MLKGLIIIFKNLTIDLSKSEAQIQNLRADRPYLTVVIALICERFCDVFSLIIFSSFFHMIDICTLYNVVCMQFSLTYLYLGWKTVVEGRGRQYDNHWIYKHPGSPTNTTTR